LTKTGKHVWIYTGNKLAKFHGNILSLSENIAKSFSFSFFSSFDSHCRCASPVGSDLQSFNEPETVLLQPLLIYMTLECWEMGSCLGSNSI